jgi:hypothetical protein
MENQNNENLFENAISMQELEPRLELAAFASEVSASVTPTASYTTGDSHLTYNVTGSVALAF